MDLYNYDQNLSTVNKVQREYWMAKQVLKKRLGKEEDRYVVAGDNDIDCKLAQYDSIQNTCTRLLKGLDKYHTCICILARDENNLGRFLKDQGSQDSTQAGKMMIAVGKALSYSAQQRLELRHPMGRLREDIETFRQRAIADTNLSVRKMEEERTHYRASLLWMRDISETLDPEQYRKLEKFKKVQNEVRINKDKFDRLKWAVCQKIDLLSASRSNLFSNTLIPYQNKLLHFWEKTARSMAAVLESFNGYQHYEFKLLKDLNPIQLCHESEPSGDPIKSHNAGHDDALIDFENEELGENPFEDVMDAMQLSDDCSLNSAALQKDLPESYMCKSNSDIDLWNDFISGNAPEGGEFEDQWKSAFGDFAPANPLEEPGVNLKQVDKDLIDSLKGTSQHYHLEPQSSDDNCKLFLPSQLLDMRLLNYGIPGITSSAPKPPSYQSVSQMTQLYKIPQQPMMTNSPQAIYMPGSSTSTKGMLLPQQWHYERDSLYTSGKDASQGKSDWYNLFAELDPLQNPDALGKKENDKTEEDGRAC